MSEAESNGRSWEVTISILVCAVLDRCRNAAGGNPPGGFRPEAQYGYEMFSGLAQSKCFGACWPLAPARLGLQLGSHGDLLGTCCFISGWSILLTTHGIPGWGGELYATVVPVTGID